MAAPRAESGLAYSLIIGSTDTLGMPVAFMMSSEVWIRVSRASLTKASATPPKTAARSPKARFSRIRGRVGCCSTRAWSIMRTLFKFEAAAIPASFTRA